MVANLPEKIRIGVVKVGIAGTKIEVWDKDSYKEYLADSPAWKVAIAKEYGGNPYGYLLDLAKIAQKDGVIKGIPASPGRVERRRPGLAQEGQESLRPISSRT